MSDKLTALQSAIEARQARIDELATIDDITPELDAELTVALDEQRAAITERDAIVERNRKIEEMRSGATGFTPGIAPNFIKPAAEVGIAEAARMDSRQAADVVSRAAEERGIDPSQARVLLKRHRDDIDWVRNIAARSTDVYESAWVKMMTGRDAFLSSEERAAIAVGTNTQGGLLVPTHLDPTLIITNDGTSNVVRSLARVVTLTREKTWNGVTTAGSTFSWDAELAEVSDDSPSFGAASIPTFKGQGFVQASIEAFEDIASLASDILQLFADGRDRLEAAAHCTGNGTTAPTGIFTALNANTNVQTTSTTAATIGLVDLLAVKRAVGPRWRNAASWLMNPVYGDAIKQLGTAMSASYSSDLTQANTPLLLGRPAYESDDAPSTQTTTALDNEIVFGDFSNYVIVDKPGSTSVQYIPVMFNTANNLPDGRVGWLMHFRSGADSVNDSAFQLLVDKTSA